MKLMVFSLFFLMLSIYVLPVHAAIQCYDCHGSRNPVDNRPVDASFRNISTGGFQGNHRTHMDASSTKSSCAKCHPGSDAYSSEHRNGLIELSSTINNSSLAAVYRNGSTAFPQRSVPRLGSCSNVNCHFERETPVWGSSPLPVPAGCSGCHGSPPDGGDAGPAGSHLRHDLYFPGTGGCGHCHSDHLAEESPFAHATSAGRRNLIIRLNSYTSQGGAYSGALDDYLPKSRSNQFGNCSNIYCHSTGTGTSAFSPNVTPTWGTPLPSDCSGCHGGDYQGATKISTGSHTIHTGRDYYGQYIYDCSICHSATATDSRTIGTTVNHVNRKVDVALKSSFGGTYTSTGHAPGGSVGMCQNVYCHSNVQPDGGIGGPTAYDNPTWGDANSVNCGDCHVGDGGHGHGGAIMATGSHTKHLTYAFTTTSKTVKCMICHKYTNQPFVTSCFGNPYGNTVCHWGASTKHANGQVDVRLDPTFGNISAYQGAPQPGNGYSNCLNTYCHSNGISVATGQIPPSTTTNWGSGALACNTCHGNPPSYANGTPKANSHPQHSAFSCSRCHYGTTTTGTTITSTILHVNKAYDVSPATGITFTYSYAATGGACSTISCHGNGTATWGGTLACDACHEVPPATPSHLKHFGGTTAQAAYGDVRIAQDFTSNATNYIMNCGNCHPIAPSKHGNGVVDVELYNPQAPAGSLKALNPATAAYTNGTTNHTDNKGFTYTNGTCSNVYCHSYNDWTTPGGVASYTNYSTYWPPNLVITKNYKTVTWNGAALTCSGCHANPPRTSYPANDLGSGDSHSWINAGGAANDPYVNGVEERHNPNMGYGPMSCRTCHNETVRVANTWSLYTSNQQFIWNPSDVPINNYSKHVNGSGSVNFDTTNPVVYNTYWYGTVIMNLSTAQYDSSRKTCSNVSCHQNQKSIKWGVPYNNSTEQCYVCHQL